MDLPAGIDPDRFELITNQFFNKVTSAREQIDINKNVVDPFAAVIEAAASNLSMIEWVRAEVDRQLQKALSNHVGYYHQELIGLLPGWESTGTSGGNYDAIHRTPFQTNIGSYPVIAEVKNKHNTMNSSSTSKLRENFISYLGRPEFKGYVAYLIQIIPRPGRNTDIPWVVNRYGEWDKIRLIDAKTVYERSTQDPDALRKVFEAIPVVLSSKIDLSKWEHDLWRNLYGSSIY
ncbi:MULTISPECIES: Eco47II family restriction endonuclease [unclassified Arthrobacter]|uniref:Eco47II family restriction endonuclease n=1 Tax=unclassified Arthrobacter TaxID=235627 RepID=UPI0015E32953|nr:MULTISPECIES: Eco47II family restriction endonuclease [unclassified Arthrobacter]